MYLDSAYIAKVYVNEADSPAVRAAVQQATSVITSAWAVCEVQCVFHRHLREGSISPQQCQRLAQVFLENIRDSVWTLVPVTESLLRLAGSLTVTAPPDVFLRAGDALHLATVREAGESEIWTNDRRMLAAAPYFGIIGRSV
jgi:predicted nucleic acid-binding protein